MTLATVLIPPGTINSPSNEVSLEVDSVDQPTLDTAAQNTWGSTNSENFIISTVFNLSLLDFGNEISNSFAGDVTLGFFVNTPAQSSSYCLGYIVEALQNWKCQDNNLIWVNSSFVYCNTNHFTAFAIIADPTEDLQITSESSSRGLSNSSIAGIVVAVFVVAIVGVVGFIFYLRKKDNSPNEKASEMEDTVS